MAKRDFRALKGGADTSIPETTVARLAAEALSTPDTLDAASLSLLNDLQRDVQHAQGVFHRFAQGLAQKYQIGPKDKLDITTGVITRAEAPGNG